MSIVSDECIYLFDPVFTFEVFTLGETTCLQGLSLFCCSKLRGQFKKMTRHRSFSNLWRRRHEECISPWSVHHKGCIPHRFCNLISLNACMCSGSCVSCHGHLKAVCRFEMFSVCTPLPADTGRDLLELCQRHSRLCFLYGKLPCCCSLWFKAAGQFRFFPLREIYLQMPNRAKGFS